MGIEVQSTRIYFQSQGQIKSPESTNLLYTSTSKCMASQNSLFQILACNECTKKPSSKSISSAICIHDLLVCQPIDGEELWFIGLVSRDHNGAFGALGENHDTAARRVGFGQKSDAARNACNVFGVWITCCVCVRLSLTLVADENISVRQDLFQLLFEKLGDERGGDIQAKGLTTINCAFILLWLWSAYLSSSRCLGAQLKNGFSAMGEEVTLDIEEFCVFYEGCNFGRREMRLLEFLRNT